MVTTDDLQWSRCKGCKEPTLSILTCQNCRRKLCDEAIAALDGLRTVMAMNEASCQICQEGQSIVHEAHVCHVKQLDAQEPDYLLGKAVHEALNRSAEDDQMSSLLQDAQCYENWCNAVSSSCSSQIMPTQWWLFLVSDIMAAIRGSFARENDERRKLTPTKC